MPRAKIIYVLNGYNIQNHKSVKIFVHWFEPVSSYWLCSCSWCFQPSSSFDLQKLLFNPRIYTVPFSLFVIFGDLAFGILKLHIISSRHFASALQRCLFLRLNFTFSSSYRLHSIDINNAADILRLPARPRPWKVINKRDKKNRQNYQINHPLKADLHFGSGLLPTFSNWTRC